MLDRSKFEEDHGFHLEVDDVVDGSVFACLRLLASLSQKEDSRGLRRLLSLTS